MKQLKQFMFVVFMLGAYSLHAQSTMKDLFVGNAKLTFLGADFTQAKFIGGSAAFTNPEAIKTQVIPSINGLLIMEPKKYALDKPFKLPVARYETYIDNVTQINKDVKVDENITMDPYELSADEVKKVVSKYNFSKNEGVGVLYVVESLDKTKEQLPVWVTFIDLSNKQVLHTERIVGKPAGFGFRNYWAGGLANVGKQIGSKYYKTWLATYTK